MIASRNEIEKLIKEYMKFSHELTNQFFISEEQQWDGKRQAAYANGVILGKYREKDAGMLAVLDEGVSEEALKKEIEQQLEHQIHIICGRKENPYGDMTINKTSYHDLMCMPLDEWIDKHCQWIMREKLRSLKDIKPLLFLYYAYDNYRNQNDDTYNSETDELEKELGDIEAKQSQFRKYGLVSVGTERELLCLVPPRIYDKSLDKTYYTKNIPLCLLKQLEIMKKAGLISELSVRLQNQPGIVGRSLKQIFLEAVERGRIFDFSELGECSVSRLYSENYADCLWVAIDPQNITFEELCSDQDAYNGMIVTQVVHLQYKQVSGEALITHLDHEYIFYTNAEYEARKKNASQKGEAKARMKSFKIDNSEIPFDYMCDVQIVGKNDMGSEPFLYYVLDCYFEHKDLIKEYFSKK